MRNAWRLRFVPLTVLVLLVSLAGLSLVAAARQPSEPPRPLGDIPTKSSTWVAPGAEVISPPKPFNPLTDRAVSNTRPQANAVGRPGIALPERAVIGAVRVGDPEIPDEFPGSGDAGFWIEAGNGVFSGNDARRNLSIPNNAIGTTIYAPTHMPAGNACIETVTAHWRFTGMGETAHGHGFWDHCIEGGWDTFEFMDSSWVDTYIRLENGVERYWTEVYESNGCWYGLLYNWDLEQWEHKVSPAVCDSSEFADGWTMWESHYLMDQAQVCPSFPPIRAADVSIWDGSSWNHLSTSDSSDLGPYGLCWQNETYTLQVHSANHDWEAYTPDP